MSGERVEEVMERVEPFDLLRVGKYKASEN